MRKLKTEELDLILSLLKDKASNKAIIDNLHNRMVEEMDDGGMGALLFLSDNEENRTFGEEIAEISLLDSDGVPVSFALYLDNEGDVFELDVFKADSSPLKQFPRHPYKPLPSGSDGNVTTLTT